jgi:N-formylmaleamate deformylase
MYGGHVGAGGVRLHYLRFGGRGSTLFVVPGITSPAETWDFVGDRLGEKHDVYIMDVRGRGLSAAGPDIQHGLDVYASDVDSLIAGLGKKQYILLGHSMGARIAARVARRRSSGLRGVIFADPPVSGPGRRRYPKSLEFYLDAIKEAQRGDVSIEALRAAYPRWTDDQLHKRAEWLHTCDPNAVAASYADFHTTDFFEDLSGISVRGLLMVAGQGGVILESDVDEILKTASSLEVERFPQCSHMLPFDDLEAFSAAVERFVAKSDRSNPNTQTG